MTDAETRAELERIDPELCLIFDRTIPVEGETLVDGAAWQKALRLLAEKHKALREIAKAQNPFKHSAINAFRLGYCDGMDAMQQIAKNACKEE